MKIKWGAQIGPEWVRYLGKEWRCREDNGHFEVRVPPTCWSSLLDEARLQTARTAITQSDMSAEDDPESPPLTPEEQATYRRFIGKLLYATQVRPGLAYTAVKELARHVAGPTQQHMRALLHLLRYVKGTQEM
eukprot:16440506-Heterocapsa_arctica.AAC.1